MRTTLLLASSCGRDLMPSRLGAGGEPECPQAARSFRIRFRARQDQGEPLWLTSSSGKPGTDCSWSNSMIGGTTTGGQDQQFPDTTSGGSLCGRSRTISCNLSNSWLPWALALERPRLRCFCTSYVKHVWSVACGRAAASALLRESRLKDFKNGTYPTPHPSDPDGSGGVGDLLQENLRART